jgi:hypothetical protein
MPCSVEKIEVLLVPDEMMTNTKAKFSLKFVVQRWVANQLETNQLAN